MKFSPCSKDCPAVTGVPSGSIRYCPMQENDRHHSHKGVGYNHPDYTDCCLNFQCCADPKEAPALEDIFTELTRAAMEDIFLRQSKELKSLTSDKKENDNGIE